MAGDDSTAAAAAPSLSSILQNALPGIISRGKVVVSPYPFATSDDDMLRVTVVNSVPGVVVNVHGRLVTKAGEATPFRYTMAAASNRLATTTDFNLAGGYVSNLSAFASGASPLIGQTFVIVQIVRGAGVAAFVLGTLLSGYVTTAQPLGWPGSPIVTSTDGTPAIRTILGTTPAAGAAYTETVPTNARWRLLNFHAFLTSSGAAASRQPILQIAGSAGRLVNSPQAHVINASTGCAYFWLPGMPISTDFTPSGPGIAGLPTETLIGAGTSITDVGILQAGDQWNAPVYTVEEYLDF